MLPEPIPDRGPDEEPDDSSLSGGDWDGPEQCLPEQGLFVCLPAEELTLAGFAQDGRADTMEPGPLLATVVHTVTGQDGAGLAGCSDDQLMGIISAARRMESRAAWTQMAAMKEFAARHAGSRPADEFAPEELAFELHLTPQSAAGQMDYAGTVAKRLPHTFAALAAGKIHPVHVRIVEDETRFLGDEDAAKADAILAETAPGQTFGELRHAAHKLILKLDPEAARKRKEATRGEAHVRRFREDSGNAGMVARELPSDEVLASWQHVEQRALDLRAAGMPGTLQELRVQAYLDLLQERDRRNQPAAPAAAGTTETSAPDQPAPDSDPPGGADPDPDPDPGNGPGGPGGPGPGGPGPGGPGPAAPAAPAAPVLAAPVLAAPVLAAPVLARARLRVPAWPRWLPSPSPGPPCGASPARRAKPAGSGCWTATPPATWPPPRPATRPPGGASPR